MTYLQKLRGLVEVLEIAKEDADYEGDKETTLRILKRQKTALCLMKAEAERVKTLQDAGILIDKEPDPVYQ